MEYTKFNTTKNDQGRTAFKLLVKYFDNVPISRIERVFRQKDIKINGIRNINKNHVIQENDLVEVYGLSDLKNNESKINKNIKILFHPIYEDENILLIHKPEKIAIHSEENCIDEQVLSYLKFKKVDSFVPSHVGRLDKETSGIMLYAKNYETLQYLNENIKNIEKTYIFKSDFNNDHLTVEGYIYHDNIKQKMKISKNFVENSKKFTTKLFMIKDRKFAKIITGRKHQIRATLSYLGYPIYGDHKYGGKKFNRLMLHAYSIKFRNMTGKFEYLNEHEYLKEPNW
ncbi:RluA family pseudouridine synthase [Mycoplasma anserisalpingitidis]|uniref:RNA pseudouridylate synthase n=1 Tax=Mycoplasma anserisalpingitidis TaxID=519450 RepID=A0A5B8JCM1_9MOLU|nr:RluA family pseudouridine synthase [Mycoplasma anserisalpingitidis]QDY87043.1 RluA family pseudouridine synthase [Mycoplasma anserisalpingitidis]